MFQKALGRLDFKSWLVIFLLAFTNAYSQKNSEINNLSALLKQPLSDTSYILALNELAFNYIHINPSIAMDDVAVAKRKAYELDYNKGKAVISNTLGSINWALANYPEALEDYHKALKYFDLNDDKYGRAKCYNNIGLIYDQLQEYDKALDYFLRSIALLKEYSDISKSLLTYFNIGEVYLKLDNVKQAKHYFDLILKNADFANDKILGFAYVGLGDAAYLEKNYSQAISYYDSSFIRRHRKNNMRGVAEVYVRKGALYEDLKIYDSAHHYFDSALRISTQINGRDLMLTSIMGLTRLDSINANYKGALSNYIRYSSIKDTLLNEEKINQLVRLETEYSMELLQKSNETALAKVKQQNTLIIGIVMIMFLSIALAGTFYSQQRSLKQVNFLLAEKNQQINSQKEKIEAQATKLKTLNTKLGQVNESLENQVKERTEKLLEQNQKLSEYAYTNAHELRAPVANILGLVSLLSKSSLQSQEAEILSHLSKSASELDDVIKNIRRKLEEEEGNSPS